LSFKAKIEIDGMKELNAAIAALGSASAKGRVTRAAVNAGGRVIRKQAKANARKIKRTGALAKSTDMKVKTYKQSGNTVAIIGPQKDFTITDPVHGKVNPRLYAHLVELGTERSQAKPFLRAALLSCAGTVASVMQSKARDALAREVAKAAKKGRR